MEIAFIISYNVIKWQINNNICLDIKDIKKIKDYKVWLKGVEVLEKVNFIAHREDSGREQPLAEHLKSVAATSRAHACDIAKDMAFFAGLLHDIGKYSAEFQERIRGSLLQVEHASAGALEVRNDKDNSIPKVASLLLQYVIMGHHSGLPDGGSIADNEDRSTLYGRIKRKHADYSLFKEEIKWDKTFSNEFDNLIFSLYKKSPLEAVELFAFFTRYVDSRNHPNKDDLVSADKFVKDIITRL